MGRPDKAWTDAWQVRLRKARVAGDLEACLALRNEDADAFGFSDRTRALALQEERDWHTAHAPAKLCKTHGLPTTGACDKQLPASPLPAIFRPKS